jgi:rare lipoprotein A
VESRGVSVLALLAGFAGVVLFTGDAVAAQCGKAAWYDLGGQTASGERSDGSALAAAHPSLPFGTKVRVENLANGRDVIVRINDRGPFTGGRVIDVTRAAAEELGMIKSGIAKVRVSVVDGKAKLDGSCEDPAPRVITAEAVASDAGKAKAPPDSEPSAKQTAAVVEPEAAPAEKDTADAGKPAEEPGTVAATPSPNQSKPSGATGTGRVLVARVQYDESSSESAPARSGAKAPAAGTATFSEDPQVDELEDAKIVVAEVDIPLPRPRPPVFGDTPPTFNRTLALRFLDAFAPDESGMELTVPLGYAPTEARGAIITE